jgi:hypothetical protein
MWPLVSIQSLLMRFGRNKKTGQKIIIIDKDENGIVPTRLLKGQEMPVSDYIFAGLSDEEFKEEKEISGKELIGLKYQAPFDDLPFSSRSQKRKSRYFPYRS